MASIAANMQAVRERIARAVRAAQRDSAEVTLLAVSKTVPAERIKEAYAAGQRAFGENYAQELRDKSAALAGEPAPPEWHFIGPLQSNKVKYIAGKVALIAGVTSDLTAKVKAGELVNFVAQQVGGKGGGRPDMAQAGGTEPAKLPGALETVRSWVEERV